MLKSAGRDYTIRPSRDDFEVLDVVGPSGYSVFTYCEEVGFNLTRRKE
jgi:hypothetical protein